MSQSDWIKTVVEFSVSTLGFLVALLINSLVEFRRDKEGFHAMMQAIKSEAINNKVVLCESFQPYYQEGVVLRGFFQGTISQYLGNQLFIKHVKSTDMEQLTNYFRNITLANAYRDKAERFRLEAKQASSKTWLPGLMFAWEINLKECQDSINRVIGII